ncbi:MAG: helix-turn-helix transcriptional regulator [Armatimonadetes bacterium]|nr:helix-turn-helix transcriptional regulator [Armatimonadota bacterium]
MELHRLEQLKAVADPTRLAILAVLREHGETCVCEILAELGTSQPNISAHLRVLRTVGLIRSQKIGKWVFYALDEATIAELLGWLAAALAPGDGCAPDGLFACCRSGVVPLSWSAARQADAPGECCGAGEATAS